MPRVLRLSKSPEQSVKEMAKFLLENGRVEGVLTLRKIGENGAVAYSLISNPDELDYARPLYPLMPVNSGKLLSLLTLRESATEPVAVVLRPCELRAFVELVKREQGSTDNLLLISSTCGGVYPLEMALEDKIEEKLPQYWGAVKQGEVSPGIRPACKACDHFVPYTADITVSLLGNKDIDRETVTFLNTGRGENFLEGMSGEFSEEELDSATVERIRSQRQSEKQKLFDETEIRNLGIDELTKAFSKCIGCHNCSKVCPICYCHLCFFDSEASEHDAVYYATQLERRGSVEAFPDTIFYHLVRLSHVSTSCVGCGMCSDVCPASIPLWAISLRVAEAVQKAYDYLPGKDMEEGLPLTTFRPEESAAVG
jgi:formate dehydrogenase subunit beta